MADEGLERRSSSRVAALCPATVFAHTGDVLAKTRAHNISDGGMLIEVPSHELLPMDMLVNLAVSVPHTDPRGISSESFTASARVVRHHPSADENVAFVGLAFENQLSLGLA